MKKTTTLLVGLGFAMLCHAQLLNPGFESWEEKTIDGITWMEPTDWFTYNTSMHQIGFERPVSRTTDAHSGQYAVKLVAMNDDAGAAAGVCASGHTFSGNPFEDNCGDRFKLTKRIKAFSAWYKYTPIIPEDSFLVIMSFFLRGKYYGSAYYRGGAAQEYTHFDWVLSIPANKQQPDSAKFTIYPSDLKGQEGSELIIDDIEVRYEGATGLSTAASEMTVSVFPNPTTASLNLSNVNTRDASYTITDIRGKKVQSGTCTNPTIDVQQLECGMYILKVITRDGKSLHASFNKR